MPAASGRQVRFLFIAASRAGEHYTGEPQLELSMLRLPGLTVPLVFGFALLAGAAPLAAQATKMPAGVTASTIAAGRTLFHGAGGCAACHGDNGVGTAEGPSLTTGPWKLGDGSFPWLVHFSRHAGWGARGRDADPQPMRGPGTLDSTQVRRVAAYVFSISRAKAPAPPGR
jgi:mono/diheme cytochrome c family protein